MVFSDVVAVDEHIRMEHADEMFETPKVCYTTLLATIAL